MNLHTRLTSLTGCPCLPDVAPRLSHSWYSLPTTTSTKLSVDSGNNLKIQENFTHVYPITFHKKKKNSRGLPKLKSPTYPSGRPHVYYTTILLIQTFIRTPLSYDRERKCHMSCGYLLHLPVIYPHSGKRLATTWTTSSTSSSPRITHFFPPLADGRYDSLSRSTQP